MGLDKYRELLDELIYWANEWSPDDETQSRVEMAHGKAKQELSIKVLKLVLEQKG